MILEILATILILIADWQLFKKMGREGWELRSLPLTLRIILHG